MHICIITLRIHFSFLLRRCSNNLFSNLEPFLMFFNLFSLFYFFSFNFYYIILTYLLILRHILIAPISSTFTLCWCSGNFWSTSKFWWKVSIWVVFIIITIRKWFRNTCLLLMKTKVWWLLSNLWIILLTNSAISNLGSIWCCIMRISTLLSWFYRSNRSSWRSSIISTDYTYTIWTLTSHGSTNCRMISRIVISLLLFFFHQSCHFSHLILGVFRVSSKLVC